MDSKASLPAAVIMLGSIKSSDCSPYVGNDNDHGYLPICSIIFRLCKDRGFCKHKINSPIDEKMRDPATKNDGSNKQQLQAKRMRKTRSAVKFIVRHTEPYYTITYQRQLQKQRQPKVAKTETATGNNTCV